MLSVTDLHVRLGGRAVLDGVSLSARSGEVTAICGPNGAGKSTLLRACLGEIPSRGAVSLNGMDMRKAPASQLARIRAVLPQETQIAFAFTVAEVVAMGLEAGDFIGRRSVAAEALAAVGLNGYDGRDFQTLSGGEKQRAHLARALAQVWEPQGPQGARWLLLDEPVSSLDLGHQLLVMQIVRHYADQGGGVIMVIHDLNLAAKVSDRIAFLAGGRIMACDAPDLALTGERIGEAFQCRVAMKTTPPSGPWFLPQSCSL